MRLFRQPPIPHVLGFDALSVTSAMHYHLCYHHSTPLHYNHLVFLNTYVFGVLLACASVSTTSCLPVCFVACAFASYPLLLALKPPHAATMAPYFAPCVAPYAAFCCVMGWGAWALADTMAGAGAGPSSVALAGLGIVLGSFAAQLCGHARWETFAAPPHLFHGFFAAPTLEYISLLFRLGCLPKLGWDVRRAVERSRDKAGQRH